MLDEFPFVAQNLKYESRDTLDILDEVKSIIYQYN